MDKQLLHDYRERYRIVTELEQREQQAATIAERWQQLNALWSLAIGLGISNGADTGIDTVRQRWVNLKEQYERTG
jgi:hypothetical protein